MKKKISLLGSILLFLTGLAQNPRPINLDQVLAKVKEKNFDILIAEQNLLAAKADVSQSAAVFLPTIKASHTGIATTNPLMAFGSKLNQKSITAADFDPNLLNNPNQIQNFATRIDVLQPLLNFDGFYGRKAALQKEKATALQGERTKEYMILEAKNAYMQLQLAYKNLEVLQATQKTVLEHKKIATNNFEQGYIQKADVLSVEIRETEIKNHIQQAKNQIEQASNYLLLLTNDETETHLIPEDNLQIEELNFTTPENNIRSDIAAMQAASDAYQLQYKSEKSAYLPSLNAFGSYELHDDEVFKGSASGYTFGAQLSWTLFEGNKRIGTVKKSKTLYNKSKIEYQQYLNQEKNALKNAKLNLNELKNNLKLSELAMQQSKEVLRIRENRFIEGLEKTSDLLQAETQFAQKELAYNAAIYQHNYALAYVQFLQF